FKIVNLVFLYLIIVIPFAWLADFYTRGEAREALNALGACNGEWLWPIGYDENRSSKPPLYYWLVCLFSLSNLNELFIRLPSVLAGLGVLIVFYIVCARSFGELTALVGGLLCLTSPMFISLSEVARLDMLHSALLAITWLTFAFKSKIIGFVVGSLCLTGSVLTKGPVALILTGLVLALFFVFTRDRNVLFHFAFIIFVSVIISSFWYLAVYFEFGDNFLRVFVRENLYRFFGSEVPHSKSAIEFLLIFFLGLGPIVCISLVVRLVKVWKNWDILKLSINGFDSFSKKFAKNRNLVWFLLCAIIPLLFYSFSSGKRPAYALVSAFFIIFLSSLIFLSQDRFEKILFKRLFKVIFLFVVLVGLFVSAVLLTIRLSWGYEVLVYTEDLLIACLLGFLMLFILFRKFHWAGIINPFTGFRKASLVLSLTSMIVFNTFCGVLISKLLSHERFADWIRKINANNLPVFSWNYQFYGAEFYLGQKIRTKKERVSPPYLLLLPEKELENFISQTFRPYKFLPPYARYHGYVDKFEIKPVALMIKDE
ncbi:MAG: glycosyltransferase family 39 protein, partial [Patescibacteria group bacterium]|nr:glycosyltransferase family 39 protein [Patescibacteria group bacterium]